ncbi:hypothetical protein B0O80DRAFT_449056 [Mortierella sp. GBAus27b]|nr:hypothetical protein BGX31_007931 [Mortierella sp. GBA43]KAI8355356.1 hypothetical protein B0O80DRAFT_449056 [Mortierella sp. GBAus27b]
MDKQRSILIPELAGLVARNLTTHDLTVCLRVCRGWLQEFAPILYRNICVYDFDFYSTDGGSGFPPRTDKLKVSADDVGYGGRCIHKYGHLIKTITTNNVHSLQYLGDGCVNLTRISVDRFRSYSNRPVAYPDQQFWTNVFRKATQNAANIWADLIGRNPMLVSVVMDLGMVDGGFGKIAEALGRLEHLKEVHLYPLGHMSVIDDVLDHCPNITKLVCRAVSALDVNYIFRGSGQPTKIRFLDLAGTLMFPSFGQAKNVIRRCPGLNRLSLAALEHYKAPFTVFAEAIRTSECHSTLKRLDVHGVVDFTLANQGFRSLLHSSEALAQISIPADSDFPPEYYLKGTGLMNRLVEFRYRNVSVSGSVFNKVPGVLELCPVLQVFELTGAFVTLERFLEIDWACVATLKRLYISICKDGIADNNEPEDGKPNPQQDAIFKSLSRLRALEELLLGEKGLGPPNTYSICTNVNRSTLKKLRHLPLKNLSVLGHRVV